MKRGADRFLLLGEGSTFFDIRALTLKGHGFDRRQFASLPAPSGAARVPVAG